MTYQKTIKSLLIAGLSVASFSQLCGTASAQEEPVTLEIENFIGRLTIKNGDTVSVKGERADSLSQNDNLWTVNGGEEAKVTNCREKNSRVELSFGSWSWRGRSGGYKDLDDYPHLKVTLPANAHLKISKSMIYGDGGDLGSAEIALDHCGDLVLGSIKEYLKLDIHGSADFKAEGVGTAEIAIRGSGDVSLDEVGDFSFRGNGSGDVDVAAISGTTLITTNGSGDIELDDLVGNFEYSNQGSGDLSIDHLEGSKVNIRLNGSGDVEIDSCVIETLSIKTNG